VRHIAGVDDGSTHWGENAMSRITLANLIACAALAAIPVIAAAQAPNPPPPAPLMPPSLPPTHIVDLMTTDGSAAFGAKWKVSDVKIVEAPAIKGAMAQYKTARPATTIRNGRRSRPRISAPAAAAAMSPSCGTAPR
jgi:hypothetical protein